MAIGTSTAILGAAGIGAASSLLGGKKKQTVAEAQQLTPEASAAYNAVQRGATSLYNQNLDQVAGLDDASLQGLDLLAGRPVSPFLQAASGSLSGIVDGGNVNAMGMNPYTGDINPALQGVSDAIMDQVGQAVGDRFALAGRSGSPAEVGSYAKGVTQQLAPYMFGSFENQMDRNFNGYENYANRDLTAQQADLTGRLQGINLAPGLDSAMDNQAYRLLSVGDIRQQQEQKELDAPYTRFDRYANPLLSAAGGQPYTKTSTASSGGGGLGGAIKGGAGLAATMAGLLPGGGLFGGAGGGLSPIDVSALPQRRAYY